MLIRNTALWLPGGVAIPDVEFLDAVQVAETDGTNSVTELSGSFTPHANADFVIGVFLGRNAATGVAGSAMSLNSNSMGAALSSDDSLGSNRPHIQAFGTNSFSAGTLAYTRTDGAFVNGQLWGASFRYVDSVGTPVKAYDADGASPAQIAITPLAIGDMIVVIVNNENAPSGDGELTAVNCVERLDLVAPDNTGSERTIGGLGTHAVETVSEKTVGFSFGGTPDQWTIHAIPLRKATS